MVIYINNHLNDPIIQRLLKHLLRKGTRMDTLEDGTRDAEDKMCDSTPICEDPHLSSTGDNVEGPR